ncbi:uncharacterized protein [Elaeis guineensis]|uniref:uncharacterized protein isoform X2 n=1 Tax=Elaeis guineensis var. tenera TaxID=51953 RepID=UPI003C6D6012
MNLRERFESTSGYSSMTMDSSFLALFGEIKISSNTTVLTAILSSSSPARASTLDQNQSGVFPFINFCCSLLNLKVYMRLEGGVVLAYSLLNMKIFVGQRYHHYSFHIGITPACGATTCAVAFYNFLCVR